VWFANVFEVDDTVTNCSNCHIVFIVLLFDAEWFNRDADRR
jgi:hypothetical protein